MPGQRLNYMYAQAIADFCDADWRHETANRLSPAAYETLIKSATIEACEYWAIKARTIKLESWEACADHGIS